MFKGPMDVAVQTIKNEGFMALYKGMLSPLIGIAGVNSLLFAAYSYGKKIISPYPELTLAQTAGAGAFAGAANAILASPVEMFKVGACSPSLERSFLLTMPPRRFGCKDNSQRAGGKTTNRCHK